MNDFEIGEEIDLWEMGKWKIIGIDDDLVRLEKVGDKSWTWNISNRKRHPQYKMLLKAKEGKTKEQTQKEIIGEREDEM